MNFLTINRGVLRRLHGYVSYQIIKKHYRSRAKELVKNLQCRPLSKSQIKEIKNYYASFGFKDVNTEWHRYYTYISGKFHKEYIPVDFYITVIEPYLNMKIMDPALTDKNLLNKLFENIEQAETVIKNVNGVFLDANNKRILQFSEVLDVCKKYSKLIIKPSIESGGGKDIVVFEIDGIKTDYKGMSIKEVINQYETNFLIQRYFSQHENMNSLNPSSVNTLRIITLLINDKIELISITTRVGGLGSKVDNVSSGGIWIKVKDDGLLNNIGINSKGEEVKKTCVGLKFDGFKIPNYAEIIKEVKSLHLQVPYFKLVSWDIAICSEEKPVLIEYNVFSQSIDHQGVIGPFFGEFTDEILDNCKINMFG